MMGVLDMAQLMRDHIVYGLRRGPDQSTVED